MTAERERSATQAFISLANGLAEGLDVVDLLGGLVADCTRLLDVASSGLLLADRRGRLHVVATSSENARFLEVFQLQREQGPCLDSFRTGVPVSVTDLRLHRRRWPRFVQLATAAGFASVHAMPMRLRESTLGTLGLFGTDIGDLNDDDRSLAQALAYVAGFAIVQGDGGADAELVATRLQSALDSRVVVEQAKGVLAATGGMGMDQAFVVLRTYARSHGRTLTDVAHAVVRRQVSAQEVLDASVAAD